MIRERELTYISLFSSAGIGCYGFKQAGFECVATCELLEKRIKIQRINNKCKYKTGYIVGNITKKKYTQKFLMKLSYEKTNIKLPT